MNRATLRLAALALLLGSLRQASASPLTLDYSVEPTAGGKYEYDFSLLLDDHDQSWKPGQGFDWLVFGDAQSTSSRIQDFTLTSSLPVGPWTSLGWTSGFHNGPTFEPPTNAYWVPTAVDDELSWSGLSATDLGQGQLLFSTLVYSNSAVAPDFQVANEVATPEPATLTLLGSALLGLGVVHLRRRRANAILRLLSAAALATKRLS